MKTSELTGAELDYWVAKAEGFELDVYGYNRSIRENGGAPSEWHPSTDWSQGGPIIEREQQPIDNDGAGGLWCAQGVWKCQLKRNDHVCEGETLLIAAMRCFVAIKFGSDVDATLTVSASI